ncbi:MAG: hypothetical protein DWI12_05715 [Planctomycetota bacterium]|nr:MAG: hypothetical protein DWI12_05715 [Planctomycetota bacterium]
MHVINARDQCNSSKRNLFGTRVSRHLTRATYSSLDAPHPTLHCVRAACARRAVPLFVTSTHACNSVFLVDHGNTHGAFVARHMHVTCM